MRKRGRPTILRDGKRRCADCIKTRPEEQFNFRTVRGKRYLMSVCMDCAKLRDDGRRRINAVLKRFRESKE